MTQDRDAASFARQGRGPAPSDPSPAAERLDAIEVLRSQVHRLTDVLQGARRAVTVLEAELDELRLELERTEQVAGDPAPPPVAPPVLPAPPVPPVGPVVIPPPPPSRAVPSWEDTLREVLDEPEPVVPLDTPTGAAPVGRVPEATAQAAEASGLQVLPLGRPDPPASGVAATGAARLSGGRRIVRFRLEPDATDEGEPTTGS